MSPSARTLSNRPPMTPQEMQELAELLQTVPGIKSIDLKDVRRLRADGLPDRVPVLGPPLERAQDQHVEGAVEEVGAGVGSRGVQGHGL